MNRHAVWFHAVLFLLAGTGLPHPYCRADDPPAVEKKSDDPNLKSESSNLKSQISDLESQSSDSQSAPSPEATLALALLGSLTPEHMKQLGQMLEQDWKRRPEWGEMAIAILKGEQMRVGMGWWKTTVKRYDWSWLRGHFDANQDGFVDREELPESVPLGDKLFARLDRDLDGKLTAVDLETTDSGGPMNPVAMLNMMSGVVFSRLDTDSNGRVSLEELAAFFAKADGEELGFLTPEDLRAALDEPNMRKQPARGQSGEPPPAEMLRMFLTGQLGWLESGPEYGDVAPDFTLPTHDGSATVTLTGSRGKKPVVLIFGSFT
jgi:hypothetical protein